MTKPVFKLRQCDSRVLTFNYYTAPIKHLWYTRLCQVSKTHRRINVVFAL